MFLAHKIGSHMCLSVHFNKHFLGCALDALKRRVFKFSSSLSPSPRPQTAVPHPQTAGRRPQTAVLRPQTAVLQPQTAVLRPQNAVLRPQTAVLRPQTAILRPESKVYTTSPDYFSSNHEYVLLLRSRNFFIRAFKDQNEPSFITVIGDDINQSSGFKIGPKYVVCTAHGLFWPGYLPGPVFVDSELSGLQVEVEATFWDGSSTLAKVLGVDPCADLAMLELLQAPDDGFLQPSLTPPSLFQPCRAVGYYNYALTTLKGVVLYPKVRIGYFAKSPMFFKHSSYLSKDWYEIIAQMMSSEGGGGMSGGPLMDEFGKAIGVLVGGSLGAGRHGVVSPVEYGLRLLKYCLAKKQNGIVYVNHIHYC